MDDLTMWSLLVGAAAPILISAVQQPRWCDRTRTLATVGCCMLLGTGTAWFNGDLSGRSLVSAVLVVLVAALSTYRNLWRTVGLTQTVEAMTSGHPKPVVTQGDSVCAHHASNETCEQCETY